MLPLRLLPSTRVFAGHPCIRCHHNFANTVLTRLCSTQHRPFALQSVARQITRALRASQVNFPPLREASTNLPSSSPKLGGARFGAGYGKGAGGTSRQWSPTAPRRVGTHTDASVCAPQGSLLFGLGVAIAAPAIDTAGGSVNCSTTGPVHGQSTYASTHSNASADAKPVRRPYSGIL